MAILDLEGSAGALNYRFSRLFDTNKWFKAAILKAQPHPAKEGKGPTIRVRFIIDAEYTDPDTKIPMPAPLMVDTFVPQTGVGTAGGMRKEFFTNLGIDDSGKGMPNGRFGIDLDTLYGLETWIKLKSEEYQGELRAKIQDGKPVLGGFQTVRREMAPLASKIDETEVPFEVPQPQ